MSKNDGGPAFPGEQGHDPDGTWNQTWRPGMSLRDWFAGQTLEGMNASPELMKFITQGKIYRSGIELAGRLAQAAYIQADAMLAKRNKEQSNE